MSKSVIDEKDAVREYMARKGLTVDGKELMNNEEVELSPRYAVAENVRLEVQRLVREEISRLAIDDGYGTFEEEDDFEVGDDYDPSSPYEIDEESYERAVVVSSGGTGDVESGDGKAGEGTERKREKIQGKSEEVQSDREEDSSDSS